MHKFVSTLLIFFSPVIAFAATTPQTIGDIFLGFSEGNLAGFIPAIVAVGVVTFFAGLVGFVGAGDNEEKRSSGQKVMTFGIVVLFVMISYWAFVGIITKSFFNEDPKLPNYLPQLMSN